MQVFNQNGSHQTQNQNQSLTVLIDCGNNYNNGTFNCTALYHRECIYKWTHGYCTRRQCLICFREFQYAAKEACSNESVSLQGSVSRTMSIIRNVKSFGCMMTMWLIILALAIIGMCKS